MLGTQPHTRLADGQDFGVRSRVVALRYAIRAFGKDLAVPDDHGREGSAARGDVVTGDVYRALNEINHGHRG